ARQGRQLRGNERLSPGDERANPGARRRRRDGTFPRSVSCLRATLRTIEEIAMNDSFGNPNPTPPTPPPAPTAAPPPPVMPPPPAPQAGVQPVIVERKSPGLAGFLSMFPGLGHLYLGLYQRAFVIGGAFCLLIAVTSHGRGGEFFGPLIAF